MSYVTEPMLMPAAVKEYLEGDLAAKEAAERWLAIYKAKMARRPDKRPLDHYLETVRAVEKQLAKEDNGAK